MVVGEQARQPAQAALDPGEHRLRRGGWNRRRGREQRAVLTQQRDDLGDRRLRREVARVAGVHPAEQRLRQPVDHFLPEARAEELGDRDVVVVQRLWRLVASALETLVRQHSRRGQAVQVQRYAEQRARQRAERVARPQLCGPGDRMHEVDPELRGQTDRLGPARQHRLRADVHLHARDRVQPQLAADGGRPLEHQHRQARGHEIASGRQAGQAAADHHDIGSDIGSRLGHVRHSPTCENARQERSPAPMLSRCRARRSWSRRCS